MEILQRIKRKVIKLLEYIMKLKEEEKRRNMNILKTKRERPRYEPEIAIEIRTKKKS